MDTGTKSEFFKTYFAYKTNQIITKRSPIISSEVTKLPNL